MQSEKSIMQFQNSIMQFLHGIMQFSYSIMGEIQTKEWLENGPIFSPNTPTLYVDFRFAPTHRIGPQKNCDDVSQF